MNTKTTISTTEARKNLFKIVEDVASPATVYTLTERGRPKAVIMSADEYESWTETFEVLRDFPDIDKRMKETEKAFETGTWKKWPVYEAMRDGVLVFRNGLKTKSTKNVRARIKSKR